MSSPEEEDDFREADSEAARPAGLFEGDAGELPRALSAKYGKPGMRSGGGVTFGVPR